MTIIRSEIKSEAKEALNGRWGISIIVLIVYQIVLSLLASLLLIPVIIFGPALVLGYTSFFLKVSRKDPYAEISTIFDKFKNFGPAWCLYVLIGIFTCLWSLLFVIPGIVKGLSYSMAPFIMIDDPEIGALEAISKSKEMTKGYKGQLFVLYLSFIGWFLLIPLTFGLISLYIVPYMQTTIAKFYDRIKDTSVV